MLPNILILLPAPSGAEPAEPLPRLTPLAGEWLSFYSFSSFCCLQHFISDIFGGTFRQNHDQHQLTPSRGFKDFSNFVFISAFLCVVFIVFLHALGCRHCYRHSNSARVDSAIMYRGLCDCKEGVVCEVYSDVCQLFHHWNHCSGRCCTRGTAPRRHTCSCILCQSKK